MYATISTAQLQPQGLIAFRQRWCAAIEPALNQIATLVDLYVFVNPEGHTLLVCRIYATEADALRPSSEHPRQL